MRRWAAWTLPLLAAVQAHAEPVPPAPPTATSVLSEEDVLLLEVTLDRATLTDSLQAYNVADTLLLPIGELVRLLDLNIDVRPRERRVIGRIGSAQRSLLVDLDSRTARIESRTIEIGPDEAVAGLTDIYLSAKLIERLLPVRIVFDNEALLVALTATEQLPIQAKLERLGRLRGLRPEVDTREEIFWVDSPPGLLSMPAFDVSLDAGAEAVEPRFRRRYDIRVGADVLYTGFQGYIGSDERGRRATSRLMFERRDLEGDLLGPVGATRFSFGDVYTPSLAVGARSIGGRGISFSTAPLEQTSVFDRVDLRGELPLGFDVELYINDVLRGGQQTPVQGRYEFLDVPLVRGVNVIRIVSYGPRGERSEETRVINVAGGALPKGELTVDVGVVQQETPLLDLRRSDSTIVGPSEGELRATAGIAYGLTEGLTLIGGAAVFTPSSGRGRFVGTAGVRTSLLGYAVQADAAYDDAGGRALSVGAAGTPLGVSTVIRHAEYRDGFVDEALPSGGEGRALERHSEATMDFNVGPVAGLSFPISARALRDEFEDGRTTLLGGLRLSTTAGRVLLSAGIDYDRTTLPDAPSLKRLVGTFAASTFAGGSWQLRGTIDYDILPEADIRAVAITADRDISERIALRLGAGRSFAGDHDTTVQAATIFRLAFADVSLAGDYTAPRNDWRVGLQMAFSLAFDPLRGRYDMTRPGAGVGGNAALQAFIDRDGDEVFDPGTDEPVPNVRIANAGEETVTDAEGRTLVTGLGYGTTARLQLDLDGIDNPYVTAPPQTIEFVPRAGVVAKVYYPLKPVGEVLARVQFRDAGGRMTGLSAVRVRAVRDGGAAPAEASTEFDGSVVFERLPVGRYRLELEPAQASRLRMRLAAPISFEIPADGGFVPDVIATVIFDQ